MKLLYILLSFALVNFLVALDPYAKQVIMANIQMIDMKAQMPKVIEKMILLAEFTMVELALMLAVPEAQDKDVASYIEQPKRNNPIENFVYHKKIDYQHIVQEKIWFITSYRAPDINEANIRDVDLNNLGIRRRFITLEAVKSVLRDVLSGDNTYFTEFSEVCRLIGIFRSIKYPKKYIKHADVLEIGECLLTDINDDDVKYAIFEDNIWEFDDKDTAKELLSSQVQ